MLELGNFLFQSLVQSRGRLGKRRCLGVNLADFSLEVEQQKREQVCVLRFHQHSFAG